MFYHLSMKQVLVWLLWYYFTCCPLGRGGYRYHSKTHKLKVKTQELLHGSQNVHQCRSDTVLMWLKKYQTEYSKYRKVIISHWGGPFLFYGRTWLWSRANALHTHGRLLTGLRLGTRTRSQPAVCRWAAGRAPPLSSSLASPHPVPRAPSHRWDEGTQSRGRTHSQLRRPWCCVRIGPSVPESPDRCVSLSSLSSTLCRESVTCIPHLHI